MRRLFLLLLLPAGCAVSVLAGDRTTADRAPPALPAATLDPGPTPYPGAAWVDGHWEWDGLQFVWTDGYWVDAGDRSVRQPAWIETSGAWTFEPGALVSADGASEPLPSSPRGGIHARGTVVVVPAN